MKHDALNHLRTIPLTQEAAISTAQNTPYVSLQELPVGSVFVLRRRRALRRER